MEAESDQVARELMQGLTAVNRRLRQVRVVAELSPPESIALASLVRNAPIPSADLARLENISPQSMGATLARLVERGLARRLPDPDDGRRVLIDLTPAGRRKAGQKRDARAHQLSVVLEEHFTTRERARLLTAAPLLERLAKNL